MAFILGSLIGIIALRVSLLFLHQSLAVYFDDVALTMVLGGTIGVAIVSAPWQHLRELRLGLLSIMFGRPPAASTVVEVSLTFVQNRNQLSPNQLSSNSLAGQVLRDGKNLMDLNFSAKDIESVLQERVYQSLEKQRQVADFFQGLTKYPPAFGLVGTVLGLVNLMRAITEGMDPKQTGAKMALALVATLYGLILANFIVAPIGEAVAKRINIDQFHAEIALQAVLLAAESVSLLKSQELLNSYVSAPHRVNIISRLLKEAA